MRADADRRCASVLVVEDDAAIREALQMALELEGFVVRTAEHGRGGLDALATIERPCLVLLDLMMPVMNGEEFLHALRERDVIATLPVVVVSAYSDTTARTLGAVGYVKKPVDFDVLLAVVHRFCGGAAPA